MSVRLLGKLPRDDRNGLARIEERLTTSPGETVVIVALLSHTATEEWFDDHDGRIVKLEVEAIEVVDDRAAAMSLLTAAHENRTGKISLPFDKDAA
jgi:hypothetical protein